MPVRFIDDGVIGCSCADRATEHRRQGAQVSSRNEDALAGPSMRFEPARSGSLRGCGLRSSRQRLSCHHRDPLPHGDMVGYAICGSVVPDRRQRG